MLAGAEEVDGPVKLFGAKTKEVAAEIDRFLDNIESTAQIFELAVGEYLDGKRELFEERVEQIDTLEHASDELRRSIKYKLYSNLLIPDARGDVLGLIETLDNILDVAKKVVNHFSIETPIVWPFLEDDFRELTAASVKSVFALVRASRAFFREIGRVNDHLNQVHFWEHEADKIEERLKRRAFRSEEIEKFSMKVHVRYFAERISLLADEAESVSERLAVYAIKRTI